MPTYVFGTDFISVTDEVRKLARNVIAGDWTDAEIQPWQYRRYSQIRTVTDYDTWIPTDREYGALQLIETKLAASDILEHYGDINTIPLWQAMREDALSELIKIVDNMETTTGDVAGSIRETGYKSWILNPSIPAPNRLSPSRTGDVEGMGSMEIDL